MTRPDINEEGVLDTELAALPEYGAYRQDEDGVTEVAPAEADWTSDPQ